MTSVSIPASVTHITDDAFCGCYYLTALSLAAGSQLENIGCNAFNGAGLSGELTLPASVKIIGDYAFVGCKLSKVYMSSEDLSGISKGAFEHINELVLHVPAYLYEKYKSHFSGYNTVEAPTLDEWKQFAKDEIKAAFDKLTYVTDNDKLSLSLHFQGIDEAEDKNAIDNYRKEAMDWISERESFCEQIKSLFGSMAAKQSGPAVEVIKGDKKVILYSPDKVNFIKVETEE